MFLLVPAYPGSPGQKAVKRLCVCVCVSIHCEEDRKDLCLHDGLVNQDASWHEGWAETTEDIEVLVLLSLDLKLIVTSKRVLD